MTVSIPFRGSVFGKLGRSSYTNSRCKVSIPFRGSVFGKLAHEMSVHGGEFPSPFGEVCLESGGDIAAALLVNVSIPFRGSVFGKSSLRRPYRDWVSAVESTHLEKVLPILSKIESNTSLKLFTRKASTHLNERIRVSAIWRDASIT